jgi:hypothetical protein
MARALGEDLRLRVLKAADEGTSARQTAARFGVGVSSAIRWIARTKTGELTPRPKGDDAARASTDSPLAPAARSPSTAGGVHRLALPASRDRLRDLVLRSAVTLSTVGRFKMRQPKVALFSSGDRQGRFHFICERFHQ